MSRSGYDDYFDDGNQWGFICWRGAVASALRGARGQAFLREMLVALDALPAKRLVKSYRETEEERYARMRLWVLGHLARAESSDAQ